MMLEVRSLYHTRILRERVPQGRSSNSRAFLVFVAPCTTLSPSLAVCLEVPASRSLYGTSTSSSVSLRSARGTIKVARRSFFSQPFS